MKVLVVEDNPQDRRAIRRHLERSQLHIEMVEAADAYQASDVLKTQDFDCLIVDFSLPGQDGLEFIRDVKANSDRPLPPIIMLTGMRDERLLYAAIDAGADEFTYKEGTSTVRLAELISSVIRRKQRTAAGSMPATTDLH